MAVVCKICRRELIALESGRCRQCRRLVCRACLAESRTPERGALCRECRERAQRSLAPPGEESGANSQPAPSSGSARRHFFQTAPSLLRGLFGLAVGPGKGFLKWGRRTTARIRRRMPVLPQTALWVALAVSLGLIFLLIVFLPVIQAKILRTRLAGADAARAERAVERLIRTGGRAVLEEMRDEAATGLPAGRERAIRVLGELGDPTSLKMLKDLAEDPGETERLRETAREAVIHLEARP
ncbi:MAG: hypothetical protein V1918_08170 [Planctomycetota bacterium]